MGDETVRVFHGLNERDPVRPRSSPPEYRLRFEACANGLHVSLMTSARTAAADVRCKRNLHLEPTDEPEWNGAVSSPVDCFPAERFGLRTKRSADTPIRQGR